MNAIIQFIDELHVCIYVCTVCMYVCYKSKRLFEPAVRSPLVWLSTFSGISTSPMCFCRPVALYAVCMYVCMRRKYIHSISMNKSKWDYEVNMSVCVEIKINGKTASEYSTG